MEKSDGNECKLYHERQEKQLCALHALNNLLQTKQAFTQKDLDDICNRLSPGTFINPHRSMLGRGNYDVNVLMAALQQKGLETVWFDKRKDVEVLVTNKIMGFILNTPSDYKLGFWKLPIHRKHWIAIRWLQGQYMNLDSKLDHPAAIGGQDCLLRYLRSELSEGDKELLLVVEQSVYESSSWHRDSASSVVDTEKEKCSNNISSAEEHNGREKEASEMKRGTSQDEGTERVVHVEGSEKEKQNVEEKEKGTELVEKISVEVVKQSPQIDNSFVKDIDRNGGCGLKTDTMEVIASENKAVTVGNGLIRGTENCQLADKG
ncbi:josephin-2 [Aplysia californica]|uniref:ubiquitinyl hydrolase 1 n=1 Tax=Aplysia californica TaxID=6500 RepID=A0ABM0JG48_APLCA|nr:josephin-2 [Aplysia californica]